MDSDGMLVARRQVIKGEGASPPNEVELLVGVILQSEDSTSQTKPNPLGKAALNHIPNGVWVDVENDERRRLDRVHVLLVLPKGVAPKNAARFKTAQRNVENAAAFMPDAESMEIPRGASAALMREALLKKVRRHFKGRGRPIG